MKEHIKSFPELVWNKEKSDNLANCPRKFYYENYVAYNGGKAGSTIQENTAYALKYTETYNETIIRLVNAAARGVIMKVIPATDEGIKEFFQKHLKVMYNTSFQDWQSNPKDNIKWTNDIYGQPTNPQTVIDILDYLMNFSDYLISISPFDYEQSENKLFYMLNEVIVEAELNGYFKDGEELFLITPFGIQPELAIVLVEKYKVELKNINFYTVNGIVNAAEHIDEFSQHYKRIHNDIATIKNMRVEGTRNKPIPINNLLKNMQHCGNCKYNMTCNQ